MASSINNLPVSTSSGSQHVSWMFELSIKSGKELDFYEMASGMAQLTEANEQGTLDYEWYVSDDGRLLHLFERYESVDAAMIHARTFDKQFAARFFDVLTPIRITLYGAVNDVLRDAMANLAPQVLGRVAGFSR